MSGAKPSMENKKIDFITMRKCMYWEEFEDTFQSRCNFFRAFQMFSFREHESNECKEKVLKFIFNFFLYHLVVKVKQFIGKGSAGGEKFKTCPCLNFQITSPHHSHCIYMSLKKDENKIFTCRCLHSALSIYLSFFFSSFKREWVL